MFKRRLYLDIIEELAFRNGKMAFVSGPRQVGKTTLAKQLLEKRNEGLYFTWDDPKFRRQWVKEPAALIPETIDSKVTVVFDEIHKASRWKTSIKSVFDLKGEYANVLITGSARLDLFRRGGDSLLGRYFPFRMHPLSIGEMVGSTLLPDKLIVAIKRRLDSNGSLLESMLLYGGFPEPFFKTNQRFSTVWKRLRTERLIREELLDISRTHEISLIEAATALLPERVGSLFSLQSLAEDLEVSPPTAKRWIEWLAQIFYLFRLNPYSRRIARSLRKQPKVYLWDWSEVTNRAARFENLVAGHLLKAVHFWSDAGFGNFDLCYIRDKEKREVDFLVLRNRNPWIMLECKRTDRSPSPNLLRFSKQLQPELTIQLVEQSGIQEKFAIDSKHRGQIVSADSFLALFP
jgi:predicted AAA+ superfamily ATPase